MTTKAQIKQYLQRLLELSLILQQVASPPTDLTLVCP